jgi:cholesterol transport system auxiliary component
MSLFDRKALLLGGLALLGGCVNLGGGKVPDHYYGLAGATLPAGAAVSASVGQALVIAEPETDRSLAVNRIAAVSGDGAVAYLKGGAWIDRPARLFRDRLAETIRRAAPRLVVFDDADSPAGAPHLSGRLVGFGYDEASHSAVVRFDALKRGADGALVQRRFEASVAVAKPEAGLVVAALGVASGRVAGQVAEWVK